jgi:hypothetical protein
VRRCTGWRAQTSLEEPSEEEVELATSSAPSASSAAMALYRAFLITATRTLYFAALASCEAKREWARDKRFSRMDDLDIARAAAGGNGVGRRAARLD